MTRVAFDNPHTVHLIWAAALVALSVLYAVWQRRRGLARFSDAHLLPALAPPITWWRGAARALLIFATLVALVIAIMGPRWGAETLRVFKRNVDVMVLLDVSRSMLARDIAPSRLERAKISLRDDLIPALAGDRVGVITFAGVPTLTCPLTDDYGFLRMAIDDITTRSSPRGGTLIGDAIRKANEAFQDVLDTHKVILLITDGEDHDSYPVQAAAALWNEHEIPVIAIALGDEREGARIPVSTDRGTDYLKYEGQTVWSKANFDDLRRIAAVSDFDSFIPVGTRNFNLGEIYQKIVVPRIRHRERVEEETDGAPLQSHWFAAAGLLLLLLDSLLRDAPRSSAFAARPGLPSGGST